MGVCTTVNEISSLYAPGIAVFWLKTPLSQCDTHDPECQADIKEKAFVLTNVINSIGYLFNTFIGVLPSLADLAGMANRIGELDQGMTTIHNSDKKPFYQQQGRFVGGNTVAFDQVSYSTPTGKKLLTNFSFALPHSSSALLMGPSGCGKSSLLRVLAGLWPLTEGVITKPLNIGNIMFLPQKPYMPSGTLADQITFPSKLEFGSEEEKQIAFNKMAALLRLVGLESLNSELDSVLPWDETLSVGEQQKISMLRVFWNQPLVAILDEATSAMDEENEKIVYTKLKEDGISFFSVGHKETLVELHEWLIQFDGKGSYFAAPLKSDGAIKKQV